MGSLIRSKGYSIGMRRKEVGNARVAQYYLEK